jgi:hypothetical protein
MTFVQNHGSLNTDLPGGSAFKQAKLSKAPLPEAQLN